MIKKVNLLVIVMGLLLVSPLALAKPNCIAEPTHPSCKNPSEMNYTVAVYDELPPHGSNPYNSLLYQPTADTDCLAQAHSHMTNFSGFFERGTEDCALTYSKIGGGTGSIRNISFQVIRDKKSGDIVSVKFKGQRTVLGEPLAFISTEAFNTDSELGELSWVSDLVGLPLTPVTDEPFIIHLHADGVTLKMCDTARVIGKTVCNVEVGKFAVEDMMYDPNLEAE